MGEPLHNYEPVRAAIRLMTDSRTFQISLRHVTLSTVGVVPRIKQLAADLPVSGGRVCVGGEGRVGGEEGRVSSWRLTCQ